MLKRKFERHFYLVSKDDLDSIASDLENLYKIVTDNSNNLSVLIDRLENDRNECMDEEGWVEIDDVKRTFLRILDLIDMFDKKTKGSMDNLKSIIKRNLQN